MSRLLPSTPDLSAADEAELRVIGVDTDEADDLIAALSSKTARDILAELHDEPATPSKIAEKVGTSLQNAQYHLSNLENTGIIEVIDTMYSEKGREMKVFAPANNPLVVIAGGEQETANLRAALTSLVGGLGLVALVGVVIQALIGQLPIFAPTGGAPEAAQAPSEGDGGATIAEVMTATPAQTPSGGVDVFINSIPPGVLFFAGGAAVLLIGFAVWYIRSGK